VRGAVYIKTTQLRQVFFDRFLKEKCAGLICRFDWQESGAKTKKRQR